MSQHIFLAPGAAYVTSLLGVIAATGCSYSVSFEDCEVSCQTSTACPNDFSCLAGVCRSPGSTGACGTVTLRETADDKVERSLVLGCTNGDGTGAEASTYRVFSLADSGITNELKIQKVTFGVCFAVGTPTAHVSLGTYGGGFTDTTLALAKVTNLKKADVTVPATQISKLVDVPFDVTVAPGTNLIVEIATDDFNGTGEQLTIGQTASTE